VETGGFDLVMTSTVRRRLLRCLSFGIAAALLGVIVSKTRFQDSYRVRTERDSPTVEHRDVVECRIENGRATLLHRDGTTSSHRAGDVLLQPGLGRLLSRADKSLLALLILLNAVPLFATALRWHLVLISQGIRVSFARVFQVNHAGAFLNHVLPGSVAGDLVKVFILPSGRGRQLTVAGTVLLTRVIGLAVTALLAGLSVTLFIDRFPDKVVPYTAYGFIAVLGLFSLAYVLPAWQGRLRRLLSRSPSFEELNRVIAASVERKRVTAGVVALSLVAQLSFVLVALGLARVISLDTISFWVVLVAHPIAGVMTALPLSPGGLGVREAAFVYLFGALGGVSPTEAVALAVLERFAWLLISLPGSLFLWTLSGARVPASEGEGGDGPATRLHAPESNLGNGDGSEK
jgi:hypothetical protein